MVLPRITLSGIAFYILALMEWPLLELLELLYLKVPYREIAGNALPETAIPEVAWIFLARYCLTRNFCLALPELPCLALP